MLKIILLSEIPTALLTEALDAYARISYPSFVLQINQWIKIAIAIAIKIAMLKFEFHWSKPRLGIIPFKLVEAISAVLESEAFNAEGMLLNTM